MWQMLLEQVTFVHQLYVAFPISYRKLRLTTTQNNLQRQLPTYNGKQIIFKLTDKQKTQILSLTLASTVR